MAEFLSKRFGKNRREICDFVKDHDLTNLVATYFSSPEPFTLSNMNISSWPIEIKFYLEHHWGGGNAALSFGPDQIRSLVSMATESSHRVTMG